jgi:hypothetical protein
VPRSVRTFLPVVGQPAALAAAFEDDPQRWLPAARRTGSDAWMLTLKAGALSRSVAAAIGRPWRAGATRWRTLTWDPITDDGDPSTVDRLLPSLDGELGLHLEPSGRVTLVLDARYQPPGGAFGDAVDAVALRRIARLTVERFLEEVSARLAAEALLIGDDPAIARDAEHDRGPTAIPS